MLTEMLTPLAIFLVVALGIAAAVVIALACMAGDFIQSTMDREFHEERL